MHLRVHALVYTPKGGSPSAPFLHYLTRARIPRLVPRTVIKMIAWHPHVMCLPSYLLLLLHSTALANCPAMHSGLSSPLAHKGQLMKHSAAVLPVFLLSIALLASSCEARGLPVHGKVRSGSSKSHRLPLPSKVGISEDYYVVISSLPDHRFIVILTRIILHQTVHRSSLLSVLEAFLLEFFGFR